VHGEHCYEETESNAILRRSFSRQPWTQRRGSVTALKLAEAATGEINLILPPKPRTTRSWGKLPPESELRPPLLGRRALLQPDERFLSETIEAATSACHNAEQDTACAVLVPFPSGKSAFWWRKARGFRVLGVWPNRTPYS